MRSLEDRFWEKVLVGCDDECWPWMAGLYTSGYGSISRGGRGSNTYAHIVSFEIHYGPVPEGLHVLHTCDYPACCNPKHLFAGTPGDNMKDKEAKGRGNHTTGEDNHSKLTDSEVARIRGMYCNGGITYAELGAVFGVSHTTVRHIVIGKKWKHINATTGQAASLKS